MAKISPSTKNVVNFEEAVSLTGYGFFNILVLLASGLCLMVVIIETMGMMFIIPASQCDLDLSLSQKSILSAVNFLGVVSSSLLWGFIADTRGRKNVLVISMVMSFLTSLSSSIIPEAWLFILVKFINGFFVGGASAVVYAYAGEFHDKNYRPKVVTWIATFVALGNMAIPGFAWPILNQTWTYELFGMIFRPWRLLVAVYSVPSLVAAIGIFFLPESPKYLMAESRKDEALAILRRMYGLNGRKGEFPVLDITWDEFEVHKEKVGVVQTVSRQILPLFNKRFVSKTAMVSFLQFGAFASTSGLMMWYPEILNQMSRFVELHPNSEVSFCKAIDFYNMEQEHSNGTESICKDSVGEDVFVITLIIAGLFAVIYIVLGSLINIIGNKNILVTFFLTTMAFGIAAQNVHTAILSQIFMAIFLTAATTIGVINTIVVELYPTQLRAMALAISLMAGRFGAVAGSHLTGPLIYGLCDFTFYIFAVDHILLTIVVIALNCMSKKKIQDCIE